MVVILNWAPLPSPAPSSSGSGHWRERRTRVRLWCYYTLSSHFHLPYTFCCLGARFKCGSGKEEIQFNRFRCRPRLASNESDLLAWKHTCLFHRCHPTWTWNCLRSITIAWSWVVCRSSWQAVLIRLTARNQSPTLETPGDAQLRRVICTAATLIY